MPWIRSKKTGERVFVPDGAPSSVPVGQPDPMQPLDIRYKQGQIANQGQQIGQTAVQTQRTQQQVMDRPNERGDKLRDDFNKQKAVQDYKTVLPVFMSGLKAQPNATGDNALIYAYARIMDPGSVVRESEMTMAGQGAAYLDTLVASYKKQFGIPEGGQLPPYVRTRLKNEMNTKVAQIGKAYDQQRASFSAIAKDQGVNPGHVVGAHEASPYVDEYNRIRKQMRGGNNPPTKQSTPAGAPRKPNAPAGRPSFLSEVGRGLYMGVGDVVQGLGNVAGLAANPLGYLGNAAIEPFTGKRPFSEDVGKDLRHLIGAPDPQSRGERIASAIGQGGVGALAPGGAARTVAPMLSGVPRAVANIAGSALGMQTAAGAASGASGEIARQMGAPPLGQAAASLVGGAAMGGGIGALTRPKLGTGIPTVPDLRAKAGELYRQAEARGVTADPGMTSQLRDDLRGTLTQEGKISPTGRINETYPKTKEAIQLADDYAGQTMTPTQLQTMRSVVAEGLMSADKSERRIAKKLVDVFDDWADPQAPELSEARDISSRYLNAEQLEKARELANASNSKFTASGFKNALRTQYRGLDKGAIQGNSRYGADLEQAIENVNRGTPLTNLARAAGRFYPSGPVSFGVGTGIPTLAATAVGGPVAGTAVGAGMLGIGYAGRKAATNLGLRDAKIAELIARNGGALPERPIMTPEDQEALKVALMWQAGLQAPQSGLFGSSRRKKKDGR